MIGCAKLHCRTGAGTRVPGRVPQGRYILDGVNVVFRRIMQTKMKAGFLACAARANVRQVVRFGTRGPALLLAAVGLLLAGGLNEAEGQGKIGPAAPVTYANRWEVYGGLNFMNFQAGQNLPKRMNLGGGELEATYFFKPNWGVSADYRGEAGTTPVFPNSEVYGIHRPRVYMNMGLGGVTWRGPRNQHAAIDLHALGGMSHGVFDAGTDGAGPVAQSASENARLVGLYSNRTRPLFALGGSLDVNQSKRWAIRLAPDLIVEHFGTETREFFAISGGVVYRFGKK